MSGMSVSVIVRVFVCISVSVLFLLVSVEVEVWLVGRFCRCTPARAQSILNQNIPHYDRKFHLMNFHKDTEICFVQYNLIMGLLYFTDTFI